MSAELLNLPALPTLIDEARRALDVAATTDKILKIRDDTIKLQKAANALGAAKEAQDRCGEIVVYAERKLGALIKRQKEEVGLNRGGRPKTGTGSEPVSEKPATLAEAGIDKKTSSRAQKLAALSDDETKSGIEEAAATGDVTPTRVLSAATPVQLDIVKQKVAPPKLVKVDWEQVATEWAIDGMRQLSRAAKRGDPERIVDAILQQPESVQRELRHGLDFAAKIRAGDERIVDGSISPTELKTKLVPIIESLKAQGRAHAAAASLSEVAYQAGVLQKVLDEWIGRGKLQ